MTILGNGSRDSYTATASQTVFPYTFEIADEEDVKVLQNGTLLTLSTDYTVSGVDSNSGGNITLVSGATAGDVIVVYRDMELKRQTDYTDSGDFLASEVNEDFDRLWMAIQQEQTDSSRAIVKPIADVE